MHSDALIVGSEGDEHVQAVLRAVDGLDHVAVLDVASLERDRYLLDGDRLVLERDAREVELDLQGARGWVRRLSPPSWRPGTVAGSRQAAERSAQVSLAVALGSHPGVSWLTPYPRLVAAENKLRQGWHARRLGLPTPRTTVTNDPRRLPRALGEEVVVKPLGPGHFVDAAGEAHVVWAQTLERDDERLQALRGAPFLLQERLVALRHLRVVTCGRRAWSCQLDAHGLPVDWRRDEAAHHAFTPASEPGVEERALRLAHDMGLGYSSQDWIDTGAATYFVDLNPAGQWLFLPEPVNQAISQAVAEHLLGSPA